MVVVVAVVTEVGDVGSVGAAVFKDRAEAAFEVRMNTVEEG